MELFNLLAKLTLDSSEYDKGIDQAQKDAESLDDIHASVDLDNSGFNDSLDESQEKGDSFLSGMGSVFTELKGVITAAGVVGAITSITGALKEGVELAAQTADGIDKGSRRLGISTQKYQEWDHALKQSGASITDLQKGVLNVNKALHDTEDNDIKKILDDLGVSTKDARGHLRATEDVINDTLIALAGFSGTTDDRGLLVETLFGKGGVSLNALLDSGEKGVKDLLNEASELGLVMSDDEINNAVAYGDAVANLNSELEAIKIAFVADIIPVLKDATEWLTSLLQTFNPRLRENSLSQTFEQLDEKATKSLATLTANKDEAQALIEKLSAMGDYWTLDDNGKKTYDALVDELIKLYPQLDEVIGKNEKAIYDNRDAILANIDAWTKLEQQRILDDNVAAKKEAVAEKYAKALDKEIEAELKDAEAQGQKALAIEQLNEALAKNEELREAVYGRFGTTTVNAENAEEILKFTNEFGLPVGTEAVNEYNKLNQEAEKLRQQADEMTKEADEAQNELTKYSEKLAEKLGLSTESVKKAKDEVIKYKAELNDIPQRVVTKFLQEDERAFPHAIGSAYIPYDNYPALLHRGEKVLTAAEARQDAKAVDFTGLEDRIIKAIQQGMENAEVNSYLDGTLVTEKVSSRLAGQLADRRYV